MTVQDVEEILEQEEDIKKEFVTTKETSQNFMEAWRGMMQQALVVLDEPQVRVGGLLNMQFEE